MRTTVLLVFVLLLVITEGTFFPAHVQIYSELPGDIGGKKNHLICYVRDFYPPDISIQLLKDGVELKEATQTDLAFENEWHFHLTKRVAFAPQEGEKFTCKVTHMGVTKEYTWDPNL